MDVTAASGGDEPSRERCWQQYWEVLAEELLRVREQRSRNKAVPLVRARAVEGELTSIASGLRALRDRLHALQPEVDLYLPGGSLEAFARQSRTLLKSITDLRHAWRARVDIHPPGLG